MNYNFNYLKSDTKIALAEEPITKEEAIQLKMVPLSIPIYYFCEHWILYNMREDCKRFRINYCFVKEKSGNHVGLSIWKSTNNIKNRQ